MALQVDPELCPPPAGVGDLSPELRLLLEKLPVAVYLCDPRGLLTYCNAQALALWGRAPRLNDPVERYCGSFRLFTSEGVSMAHEHCWMARALAEGREFVGREVVIERPDGERLNALAYASPIRNGDGELVGAINVLVDVSQQKRTEAALRHSEEALREADRRKTEFLAVLAHELRNPLHPIRSAVDLLRLDAPANPATQSIHDILDRQVSSLTRLVDDLIDVARITRGQLELHRERVALEVVLDRAVACCRPRLETMEQELALSLPPRPLFLDADPIRLTQVFVDLLDNASQYAPRGSPLRVETRIEGAEGPSPRPQVAVSVCDEGIGIAAADLEQIFEFFAQVQRPAREPRQGLGVGLTLARSIVELHGGRITAHSEGLGRGSRFVVRLPVGGPEAAQRDPPNGAPEPDASRRVLIVEDQCDVATGTKLLLERLGHETWIARDGPEALSKARSLRPDVVLLDIGLPGWDGYEVCRRLRVDPGGHALRIVAVTGWSQEEDRRRSREAGFDAHLSKPLGLAKLRSALGEGLGAQRSPSAA